MRIEESFSLAKASRSFDSKKIFANYAYRAFKKNALKGKNIGKVVFVLSVAFCDAFKIDYVEIIYDFFKSLNLKVERDENFDFDCDFDLNYHDVSEIIRSIKRTVSKAGIHDETLLCKKFYEFMRDVKISEISKGLKLSSKLPPIPRRLKNIQKTFGLDNMEIRLLEFYAISHPFRQFDDIWERANISFKVDFLSTVFGISPQTFFRFIEDSSNLTRFGLLSLDSEDSYRYSPVTVDMNIENYIRGYGSNILSNFMKERNLDSAYEFSSFKQNNLVKKIALNLLKSDSPCRILLYGAPGAGKSEFAKSIIRESQKRMMVPVIRFRHNEKLNLAKMRKYHICEYLTKKSPENIAVFDECDDVLYSNPFSNYSEKCWLNTMLDNACGKSIWICNHTSEIDASTRRRFSFCVYFDGLSEEQKKVSITAALQNTKFNNLIASGDVLPIVKKYELSVAGVSSAISNANIALDSNSSKGEVLEVMDAIASSQNEFMRGNSVSGTSLYLPDERFDISIINADHDCQKLVKTLQNYYAAFKAKTAKNGMNLLFTGVAGSGKTEFAKYISSVLGVEPVVKKLSDLLSKFVGESEKNVAAAFYKAQQNGLLIIDEADSLFYDRTKASQSWECSLTNEFLLQMERFRGIFICSTNLLENVDTAAMRRFHKKIKFGYLSSQSRQKLFQKYFYPEKQTLSEDTMRELEKLEYLTPGDFKNISIQRQYDDEQIDEGEYIKLLQKEIQFKRVEPQGKKIGFC